MNHASTINPALSPVFDRARKLSRVMAVLFAIGFWGALLLAVMLLTILVPSFCPNCTVTIPGLNDVTASMNAVSFAQRTGVLAVMELSTLPVVFLMHHTRRVFSHFANGEVFVLPVIVHIRQAGLWLIISFFAPIVGQVALNALKLSHGRSHGTAWPLVIGVVTTIAAYVMEEARRIATDHAEIV